MDKVIFEFRCLVYKFWLLNKKYYRTKRIRKREESPLRLNTNIPYYLQRILVNDHPNIFIIYIIFSFFRSTLLFEMPNLPLFFFHIFPIHSSALSPPLLTRIPHTLSVRNPLRSQSSCPYWGVSTWLVRTCWKYQKYRLPCFRHEVE